MSNFQDLKLSSGYFKFLLQLLLYISTIFTRTTMLKFGQKITNQPHVKKKNTVVPGLTLTVPIHYIFSISPYGLDIRYNQI